jgi:hypothetical protein
MAAPVRTPMIGPARLADDIDIANLIVVPLAMAIRGALRC